MCRIWHRLPRLQRLHLTTFFLVFITVIAERHLTIGDFASINEVLLGTEFQLPPMSRTEDSTTLQLSSIRCRNVQIGDVQLESVASTVGLDVTIDVVELDVICQADYNYNGRLLAGQGDLQVTSRKNSVTVQASVGKESSTSSPTSIQLKSCSPSVNIDNIDFSNGGFLGWILNLIERLARGIMEDLVQEMLCQQLVHALDKAQDSLDQINEKLLNYPVDYFVDPLQAEHFLDSDPQLEARLVDFTNPQTELGLWLHQALHQGIAFLRATVERTDSSPDMRINSFLRDFFLNEDRGLLLIDEPKTLFYNHDILLETSIHLVRVQLLGLDTVVNMDPLSTIGRHTIQSNISWEYLALDLDLTVDIRPSTVDDSVVTGCQGFFESVHIVVGLGEIKTTLALLAAVDQQRLASLRLGSLLSKDRLFPCLLSALKNTVLSSFAVEAADIFSPYISGTDSLGLQRILGNVVDVLFDLYEMVVLQRSSAMFQKDFRELLNERFLQKYSLSGSATCPTPEHNTGSSTTNAPESFLDFRDLLLTPVDAFLRGGAGTEPYGDLLSSFITPNLQAQVMTADLFNERIVRPATQAQSGVTGSFQWPDWILFNYTSSSTKLYEAAVVLISNVRIYNMDTITSPLNILDPRDWNKLSQTITFANETRHLQASATVLLAIGDESSPLAMRNHMDITIEIPRTSIELGVNANMKEDAFLNLPLVDITNPFCWLSTLAPYTMVQDSDESTTLDPLVIETLAFLVDTFSLNATCLNCSSAGAFVLSDILQKDLPDVGFQKVFSQRIFNLLEEIVWNVWWDLDPNAMLDDASHKCPKRTSDTRILSSLQERPVEKKFPGTQRKALSEIPLSSRESVETLIGLGILGLHVAAIVVAGNYLHPVEDNYFVNDEEVSDTEEFSNPDDRLIDWTNLSGAIAPGADFAFEQLKMFLLSSVDYETDDGAVKSTSRLINLLRQHVLDQRGACVISLVGLHSAIDALDVDIDASQVKLLGLENLFVSELFVPIKPQVLRTNVHLDELTLIVDSKLHLGNSAEDVEFVFVAKNITIQIDLFLAFDMEALEAIQLGSLFRIMDIIPCATKGLRDVRIHKLLISTEVFEGPLVHGFSNTGFLTSVDSMIRNLSNRHTTIFQSAMPAFFNRTFKGIANALLPEWVTSITNNCPAPPQYPDGGIVDFRDLLLSSNASSALGGTGAEPYGNLFPFLYGLFVEHVSRIGDNHLPAINDIFRYIAANQSNAHGAFQLEGNAFSSQTRIKIAGLRADLEFQVSNVTLKNIDSIGQPLELVKPMNDSPYTVSNTLSFGVDSTTLQVEATVYISVSDGAEMNIKNKLRVLLSVEDLVVMAEIALKISERAFASFPFGELRNIECWLPTILSRPSKEGSPFGGIRVERHSLSIGNSTFEVHCIECSSPNFDTMLTSLYNLENITTIEERSEGLLDTDIIPVLLGRFVEEASRRCPLHSIYAPDGNPKSFLSSQDDSLSFIQIVSASKNPAFFNVMNSVIAVSLLLACLVGRWFVRQGNRQWIKSLSRQGRLLLKRQQNRDLAMEKYLDSSTNALVSCSWIPWKIRCGVLIAIFFNTSLFLAGHLGTLSVVHLDASLAGESFTIHNFLEFHFIESTTKTYQNGGAEIAILLWIFTGVWPYIKLVASLVLWITPPSRLSVRRRGQALLWIDALAKLSVIDIITILLSFAIILVFTGGPDAPLHNTATTFYTLKIIVVPRAGFYCLLAAQRMSRVSSRFLLEYHDMVICCALKEQNESGSCKGSNDDTILSSDRSMIHDDDNTVPIVSRENQEPHKPCNGTILSSSIEAAPTRCCGIEDGLAAPSTDRWCDNSPTSELSLQRNCDGDEDRSSNSVQRKRWGTIGAYCCIMTIVIILVIGCILAPAISFDTSTLAGLAVESDMTFEDVASEYSVFIVISSILVRARFLLARKADYIGLGFLLVGAFVSMSSVFLIKAYFFLKRTLEKRRIGPVATPYGHQGCALPLYFRLHKWKYMEIFCFSLAIGVWQLGSACSYVIHAYCDILRRIYSVLVYLGLSDESAAQCSLLQVALPGNLIIICASLLLLLLTFFFQALSQYKKNIKDSLRCLDACDFPILSMEWSYNSSQYSRDSSISLPTDVVSDHSQQTIGSTIFAMDTSTQVTKYLVEKDNGSSLDQQEKIVDACNIPRLVDNVGCYYNAASSDPEDFVDHTRAVDNHETLAASALVQKCAEPKE